MKINVIKVEPKTTKTNRTYYLVEDDAGNKYSSWEPVAVGVQEGEITEKNGYKNFKPAKAEEVEKLIPSSDVWENKDKMQARQSAFKYITELQRALVDNGTLKYASLDEARAEAIRMADPIAVYIKTGQTPTGKAQYGAKDDHINTEDLPF